MHLVEKDVNGSKYFYLVEKAREGKRVFTKKTVYIGTREKLAELAMSGAAGALPSSYASQEIGVSLALVEAARSLGLEEIIDEVAPVRRGAAPVGRRLLIAAIHRTSAHPTQRSKHALRDWYEKSALGDLLPLQAESLDHRRLHDLLVSLTPAQIDAIEEKVVERLINVEGLSRSVLAFDTTNFDSFVSARTKSSLLRRGHAKSGRPLRVLGMGLLVGEDDLPLLSFTYPGNENDQKAFGRFLRALDKRSATLRLGLDATIAADGGNVSKQMVLKLERQQRGYVVRLPKAHATGLTRTGRDSLTPVGAQFKGKVWALRHDVEVYGGTRTVWDVYSKRMHSKQLPGLNRDARRAGRLLKELQQKLNRQRKSGKRRTSRQSADKQIADALAREHMKDLFVTELEERDDGLHLVYRVREEGWTYLEQFVLGRTLLLTNRSDWPPEQIIRANRLQSGDELMFRDMKDPSAVCMVPLRHRKDATLRAHALVVMLGLLLSRLLLRRARRAGVTVGSVATLLTSLRGITRARMLYAPTAAPAARSVAKQTWVPSERDPLQVQLLHALKLSDNQHLGATHGVAETLEKRPLRRSKAAQPGNSR